jgi:hypothetical protein
LQAQALPPPSPLWLLVEGQQQTAANSSVAFVNRSWERSHCRCLRPLARTLGLWVPVFPQRRRLSNLGAEISVTGRFLAQRSHTGCVCIIECDQAQQ